MLSSLDVFRDVYKSTKRNFEIRSLQRKYRVRRLSQLDIGARKRSKTLYVLGSGPSVNDLAPAQFAQMAQHDSVGFNFWLIHDFVPTYYLVELSADKRRNTTFFELLDKRQDVYGQVPLILQYKLWRRSETNFSRLPDSLMENVYLHAPWALLSHHQNLLRPMLGYWRRRVARTGTSWGLDHLVHHRASLVLAVMFGLVCGYEDIVLVGVDLNSPHFFWESDPSRRPDLPLPPNIQRSHLHATADSALNDALKTLPVTEFLPLVDEMVARPLGRRIVCANPDSLLCDHGFEAVDIPRHQSSQTT